ncbi:hypothetical protein PybrP1_005039 [[Pythium] brassicae (nom. inval.)]|nr:hypothetical protein PybrP1_005039 [[Pythium] brassicae (nom. inval.)]
MEALADPQTQQGYSQMSAATSASAGMKEVGDGGGRQLTRQQLQMQLQLQQQQQAMDMRANPYGSNPHAYAQHAFVRDRTPTPPNMMVARAVQLLAACETCLLVVRVGGVDMSFRRVAERKCPRCASPLALPQENMEMFILYGHYIPEAVGATIVLGTLGLHPSLRADFVAAVMNELLTPLQTDFVYDIAVPKRQDGLGMSLRMNNGDLVVGGFIDFEDNTESPSVAARVIAVGDALVAINKKSIATSSFETNIRMLSHAASPVYLTFRRSRPVVLL